MLSMTGFGKGEAALSEGYSLAAEISSVNRKQLEVRVTLPQELAELEIPARKLVGEAISRGSVQLKVSCTRGGGAGSAAVNEELLERLVQEALRVRAAHGLSGEVALETLFMVPGVVSVALPDADSPEFTAAFESAVGKALRAFQAMRHAEGEALKADFLSRIEELETILKQIEPMVDNLERSIKERLLEKLKVEEIPVGVEDDRLLKEVLFYADKADVTEELTRLHSHFAQFRNFLASEKPVGRSLDFLMQEFFREITTLGNKAGVPAVSPLVVAFKSNLEKLREQIQNVE